MTNMNDGREIIVRIAAVADLLDSAGMYEDACTLDDILEQVAEDDSGRLVKEAGFWTNVLSRLSGAARKLLFKEYRVWYQYAKQSQDQLESRLSEVAARVKDMRRQLKLHDVQGWRQQMTSVLSDISVPDFSALEQFEAQTPNVVKTIYGLKNQQQNQQQQGEGGAVKPVLPGEEQSPPFDEAGGAQQQITPEPSSAPAAPSAPPVVPPVAPSTPPATPPPIPPAAPVVPPQQQQEPAARPSGPPPLPLEAIPDFTEDAELIEEEGEEIRDAEQSLSPEEKESITPPEPEEATPEEAAQADSGEWTPTTFVSRSGEKYDVEVSRDGSKIRTSFEDYPRLVLKGGDLPLGDKLQSAGRGRPLISAQPTGEEGESYVRAYQNSPGDLPAFMGPYYWDAQKVGDHVVFTKTDMDLSEDHKRQWDRSMAMRRQRQEREERRQMAQRNRQKLEEAMKGAALRSEMIRKIAEDSLLSGDFSDEDIAALDEASRDLLGEEE